jgi:hypothetical protein
VVLLKLLKAKLPSNFGIASDMAAAGNLPPAAISFAAS